MIGTAVIGQLSGIFLKKKVKTVARVTPEVAIQFFIKLVFCTLLEIHIWTA